MNRLPPEVTQKAIDGLNEARSTLHEQLAEAMDRESLGDFLSELRACATNFESDPTVFIEFILKNFFDSQLTGIDVRETLNSLGEDGEFIKIKAREILEELSGLTIRFDESRMLHTFAPAAPVYRG